MRKELFGKPTAILDRLLLEKRMRMMEVHSQWALVRSCAEPAATNAAHNNNNNNNSVVVPIAAPVEMSRAYHNDILLPAMSGARAGLATGEGRPQAQGVEGAVHVATLTPCTGTE